MIEPRSIEVPSQLAAGALAGRYVIERELGRGGMATVYLAHDQKHGRPVALKILHPDLARGLGPERFLREIKVAAGLSHPHILPLFDSGETEGLLYYVMPYVEGESLRQRLAREPRLSVDEAVATSRAVASALDYAHQHGVVHRDIKPDNIMFHQGEAMVTDFGIAKALSWTEDETLTQTGLLVGTPWYMSPEQSAGDTRLDGRSDIYSLGCVLYEMLAGRKPFEAPSALAILSMHIADEPPPLTASRSDVPPAVEAAVLRALAKAPEDRFSTAAEFGRALADSANLRGVVTDSAGAKPSAMNSIAVLPFLNLSADPENEYFADGMAEEIINALTKLEGLRVTPRSSAFSLKGKGEAGREIGRRLKVATILEGSVRRAGSRIRLTTELISVADGYHLWSEKYDREMVDVFAIQDEISRSIVDVLKVKLLGSPTVPLVKRPTEDLEAYTTYLKGRYFWNRRTPEGLRKSIALFREAQARDPGYALPYAGEADAYNVLGWWADLAPTIAFPAARTAAARAVALDPALAEAYASQAFARLYYDWDWPNAEADFKQSIALNPKYSIARQWYSQHLISSGRTEEASGQIRLAAELDPLSLIIQTTVSLIAYYAGQFDDSVTNAKRIIENDPNFGIAHRILGRALLQLGQYDEGIAQLQRAVELSAFSVMLTAEVAHGHARAGHRAAALAILADLRRTAVERYVSAYDLAGIHIGLNDRASALDALEQACAERASHMIFLRVDPVFRELHGEPRFQAILGRIGAPVGLTAPR
ncbi:MAG TPA: protein kinase [Gemmatimonadales bacterium]|nr:protein kinase [Gemmatimonadales bacterium]